MRMECNTQGHIPSSHIMIMGPFTQLTSGLLHFDKQKTLKCTYTLLRTSTHNYLQLHNCIFVITHKPHAIIA